MTSIYQYHSYHGYRWWYGYSLQLPSTIETGDRWLLVVRLHLQQVWCNSHLAPRPSQIAASSIPIPDPELGADSVGYTVSPTSIPGGSRHHTPPPWDMRPADHDGQQWPYIIVASVSSVLRPGVPASSSSHKLLQEDLTSTGTVLAVHWCETTQQQCWTYHTYCYL